MINRRRSEIRSKMNSKIQSRMHKSAQLNATGSIVIATLAAIVERR